MCRSLSAVHGIPKVHFKGKHKEYYIMVCCYLRLLRQRQGTSSSSVWSWLSVCVVDHTLPRNHVISFPSPILPLTSCTPVCRMCR